MACRQSVEGAGRGGMDDLLRHPVVAEEQVDSE